MQLWEWQTINPEWFFERVFPSFLLDRRATFLDFDSDVAFEIYSSSFGILKSPNLSLHAHFSFRSARFACPATSYAHGSSIGHGANPHTTHPSGTIRETESNEAAIGVSVFSPATSVQAQSRAIVRGTLTNKVGFFSFAGCSRRVVFPLVRGVWAM